MSAATVRLWFHRLYTSLKMDGCSSHSGRHTFITRAARKVSQVGGSLRDVQELAGHTSLAMTQRYIEGDTEAKRKLVALLCSPGAAVGEDYPRRFDGCTGVVRHPQAPVYSCGEPEDVVDGIPHRPRCDPRAWERWMAQRHAPPAQQVQVAERVTFRDGPRTVAGYVARKGRTSAHVVTDAGTEVRVPYRLLTRDVGAPRKQVQSRTDLLRAPWQTGDRVAFAVGPAVLHGTISRVNPRYAHVVCDDDREYRVPYARLTLQEPQADTARRPRQRTDGDLQAIAARASAWLVAHQLEGWSFQFDNATQRAGCCNYQMQVISLAHAYARVAPDADIDDTLLHEIAHALVGKVHGHDQVWQAQAVALGCAGQRCHDIQCTPPRYIMTCAHACWVTTAERRQRGAVCRTCHGPVRYTTYTEERWQDATQQRGTSVLPGLRRQP